MAYTLTLPTLKLASGNLSVAFYSTGSSGTTQSLSDSHIVEIGELINEFEVKGGELIVNSIKMSVFDKLGKFRYNLVEDIKNGYTVRATLTLNDVIIFIGVIDKYSITIEQRFISVSGGLVDYNTTADGFSNPVEVTSFTIKDIISVLEDVTTEQLITYLEGVNNTGKWEVVGGLTHTTNSGTNKIISVKDLIRAIFYQIPSGIAKIGVQVQENLFSLMSHDYFDYTKHYHTDDAPSGGFLNRVAINKATGLKDTYLLFFNAKTGRFGSLFTRDLDVTDSGITPPADSILNLTNCLQLLGEILFSFGLVPSFNYYKKSIHSTTITNLGSGYTSPAVYSGSLSGGGGSGAIIKYQALAGSMFYGYPTINGSDYTTAPTVLLPPPNTSTQATAYSLISPTLTTVTNLVISSGGSSYGVGETPTVTIDAPPTKRLAVLEAVISGGSVSSITVLDGGSGYRSDVLPSIDIEKPLNGTKAVINQAGTNISNGAIQSVVLTSGGTGYSLSNLPTIYISAPNDVIQATATATTLFGAVNSLTITNNGSGYSSAPSVTIAPPSATLNVATATIQLSDYDVYFKKRDFNSLGTINTDIIESSFSESNDSFIDNYSVGTMGNSQHTYDTTSIDLVSIPRASLSNNSLFGLSNYINDVPTDFTFNTENYLLTEYQYTAGGGSSPSGNNKYSIARFIHDNINLMSNSSLTTSTGWTSTYGSFHQSSGGVFSGEGLIRLPNNNIENNNLIGSLNRTVVGEPLIVCGWIFNSSGALSSDKMYITPMKDSSEIRYANIKNLNYVDLQNIQTVTGLYTFFAFALESVYFKDEINKIKFTFSGTDEDINFMTLSSIKVFVGKDVFSRWLVNNYMKYFGKFTSSTMTRKYNDLVTTDNKLCNYIIENDKVYYINRISKDLVNNETEIEAINYAS